MRLIRLPGNLPGRGSHRRRAVAWRHRGRLGSVHAFGSKGSGKLLLQLGYSDLLICDLGYDIVFAFLQLAQLPHFVDLLPHLPLLLFDGLHLARELMLSLLQLSHFFLGGTYQRVDVCNEVDSRQPVLSQDMLDHEIYQFVGSS